MIGRAARWVDGRLCQLDAQPRRPLRYFAHTVWLLDNRKRWRK